MTVFWQCLTYRTSFYVLGKLDKIASKVTLQGQLGGCLETVR